MKSFAIAQIKINKLSVKTSNPKKKRKKKVKWYYVTVQNNAAMGPVLHHSHVTMATHQSWWKKYKKSTPDFFFFGTQTSRSLGLGRREGGVSWLNTPNAPCSAICLPLLLIVRVIILLIQVLSPLITTLPTVTIRNSRLALWVGWGGGWKGREGGESATNDDSKIRVHVFRYVA